MYSTWYCCSRRRSESVNHRSFVKKFREAEPRIGYNLDKQCVWSLWTARLLVRHLREGRGCSLRLTAIRQYIYVVANQNLRNLHWQGIIGRLDTRLLRWLSWPVGYPALLNLQDYAWKEPENVWKFSMLPNDTACSQKSQLLSLHFPIV